MNSNACAVTSR